MNIVIRQLNGDVHPDIRGEWVATIFDRGIWFRAPTRELLIADVENDESGDWGCLSLPQPIAARIETLTQVQEDAIAYLLSRSRPNDRRCHRKAFRLVRDWCLAHGWKDEEANHAGRDMLDVYQLHRNAA